MSLEAMGLVEIQPRLLNTMVTGVPLGNLDETRRMLPAYRLLFLRGSKVLEPIRYSRESFPTR